MLAAKRGAAEGAEPPCPGAGATGSPGLVGGWEPRGMQEALTLLGLLGV